MMSRARDVSTPVGAVPPSESIVEQVAACEGVDQTELTPLFEAIDPEALDKLVETRQRNGSLDRVTFTYHGYAVNVTGDGVAHLTKNADVDE